MAKIFNKNANQIIIPTEESNAIKIKLIEERNKELINQRVSDSLDTVISSQYGDPRIATEDAAQAVSYKKYASSATDGINQDMTNQEKTSSMEDIHISYLGKLQESTPPSLVYILVFFLAIVIFNFFSKKR